MYDSQESIAYLKEELKKIPNIPVLLLGNPHKETSKLEIECGLDIQTCDLNSFIEYCFLKLQREYLLQMLMINTKLTKKEKNDDLENRVSKVLNESFKVLYQDP